MTPDETEADFATLLAGGALPLTLSEGDTLLSQGFALPMTVDGCPLWYLYALVTAPKARGRGCLRTLLEGCAATARAHRVHGLCLLPADAGLAEAYRRMGFWIAYPIGAPAVVTDEGYALRTEVTPTRCEPISGGELMRALPAALPKPLFDFSLTTLLGIAQPMCLDGIPALADPRDPSRLLAIGEGGNARRVSAPELLLKPLGGRLPELIPEPIPR